MGWDDVVGQQRVKQLLRRALGSNRLPHAYLFYGPEGVGKDAMAIELAKVVNCEQQADEACDRCGSCLRFASLQHPNVMLIFALPVGKTERTGDPPLAKLSNEDIEQIREQIQRKAQNSYHTISVPRATTIKVNSIRAIKRDVALTTFSRGKKVVIIIDAENLNEESANALLKTLEEPTGDTLFILTTSYRDQLFPTIISRCQDVRFDLLSENEIQSYMIKQRGVEVSTATLVARLAHGSLSLALDLLEVDLQGQRDTVLQFLRTLYAGEEFEVSRCIDEIARDYDRSEMQRFLQLLQLWVRDAMCVQEGVEAVINIDQRESLIRFARRFPHLAYPELISGIDRAISLITKNAYIPLVLTVLAQNVRRALARAHSDEKETSKKR